MYLESKLTLAFDVSSIQQHQVPGPHMDAGHMSPTAELSHVPFPQQLSPGEFRSYLSRHGPSALPPCAAARRMLC